MKVIAEGVETVEQLAALRVERCDEIQGFLVGAAVPLDELCRLVKNWNAEEFESRIGSSALDAGALSGH